MLVDGLIFGLGIILAIVLIGVFICCFQIICVLALCAVIIALIIGAIFAIIEVNTANIGIYACSLYGSALLLEKIVE